LILNSNIAFFLSKRILYRLGVSEEKIREIFGVGERTVREWLKPIKEEEKREKIRKAIELREKGWKIKEISEKLGVPERTLHEWFKTAKMAKIAKIAVSLLTPDGTPTPEGLKLWSDYVSRETENLEEF